MAVGEGGVFARVVVADHASQAEEAIVEGDAGAPLRRERVRDHTAVFVRTTLVESERNGVRVGVGFLNVIEHRQTVVRPVHGRHVHFVALRDIHSPNRWQSVHNLKN